MQAVRFHEHGGPEVLKFEAAPDPKIAANEVLVRVKACALNHLDLWLRQGVSDWNLPLPHIAGSDVSGEVAEVGSRGQACEGRRACPVVPGDQLRAVRSVLRRTG